MEMFWEEERNFQWQGNVLEKVHLVHLTWPIFTPSLPSLPAALEASPPMNSHPRTPLDLSSFPQSLNGINVSKAALVHKALSESNCGHRLEISRGSGRVSEVFGTC